MKNVDADVASGFGQEWSTFRQGEEQLPADERRQIFESCFRIFPWQALPPESAGIDVGSGR